MKFLFSLSLVYLLIGVVVTKAEERRPSYDLLVQSQSASSSSWAKDLRDDLGDSVVFGTGTRLGSSISGYQKYSIGYSLSDDQNKDSSKVILRAGMNPTKRSAGVSLEVSW